MKRCYNGQYHRSLQYEQRFGFCSNVLIYSWILNLTQWYENLINVTDCKKKDQTRKKDPTAQKDSRSGHELFRRFNQS